MRNATIPPIGPGKNATSATAAVRTDPPRMIAASTFRTPNRSARNPQGISKRP